MKTNRLRYERLHYLFSTFRRDQLEAYHLAGAIEAYEYRAALGGCVCKGVCDSTSRPKKIRRFCARPAVCSDLDVEESKFPIANVHGQVLRHQETMFRLTMGGMAQSQKALLDQNRQLQEQNQTH